MREGEGATAESHLQEVGAEAQQDCREHIYR
jgi:hypothetical protein